VKWALSDPVLRVLKMSLKLTNSSGIIFRKLFSNSHIPCIIPTLGGALYTMDHHLQDRPSCIYRDICFLWCMAVTGAVLVILSCDCAKPAYCNLRSTGNIIINPSLYRLRLVVTSTTSGY